MSGKRARQKRQKERQRQTSGIADHQRQGKTLNPPLLALPAPLTNVNWARDHLPDMLWACSLLVHHGERFGLSLITQTLDVLSTFLPPADSATEERAAGIPLTGSLTSLDLIPEGRREEAVRALKDAVIYEEAFPPPLVWAMSEYDDVPGGWLLHGWQGALPPVEAEEPEVFLRRVVDAARHGQSRVSTLVKAVVVRGYVRAGKIHFPSGMDDTVEALSRYPWQVTEGERRFVEPFLRATYGALAGTVQEAQEDAPASRRWAESFWMRNGEIYACEPPVASSAREFNAREEPSSDAALGASWQDMRAELQSESEKLLERFFRVYDAVDRDIFRPDRNEVLTAVTYRHLCAVDAMIRYPAQWMNEQGTFVLRNLVESRIVLAWLDVDLYARFKNYGRGHLKLQVLHLREYRDGLGDAGNELDDYLHYLEGLLNRDVWEEMQDIRLDGNFAGIDVRRMSEQVGLQAEYRLLFAPTSSDVHGEWASLDRYVMVPCQNPLHRGHRIPNPDRTPVIRTDLVRAALQQVELLLLDYEEAIGRVKDGDGGSAPLDGESLGPASDG